MIHGLKPLAKAIDEKHGPMVQAEWYKLKSLASEVQWYMVADHSAVLVTSEERMLTRVSSK